jgi:hypothetical protein
MTGIAIAAAVLVLIPWGWRRSGRSTVPTLAAGFLLFGLVICSAAAGWDPSRAIGVIGLFAAAAVLGWLASRSRPQDIVLALLGGGLAALAIWGLWQAVVGLEILRPELDGFSDQARAYAEERLAGRRAFASLPLPSHFAVLLATALPLLLDRVRATFTGVVWAGLAVLAGAGLVATRSPVGLVLALLATAPLLITVQSKRVPVLVLGGMAMATSAVVLLRPDVMALEPVSLRLDNWQTGVWLWSTSPVSGVGVASFAQASQANPLSVGNQPAHAHSLPFEALAELGPVGLIAVILAGVWVVGLIGRLWRTNRAMALSIAVVPLHNLVDFSAFVSGVALPWAVLVGWAVASQGTEIRDDSRLSARARVLPVVAASVILGFTILHWTGITLERSAASVTDPIERFNGAQRSLGVAPWRVQPQFLLASAAIASGDRQLQDHAWTELDRLRWLRPRSAALAQRRARLALARGDVSSALAELWAAVEYRPGDQGARQIFNELLEEAKMAGSRAAR